MPAAGVSGSCAKTLGEAAWPSAFAMTYTFEPLVPTRRSPFGAAASSRAPPTLPMISMRKPAGTDNPDAGFGEELEGAREGAGRVPGGACSDEEAPPPHAAARSAIAG